MATPRRHPRIWLLSVASAGALLPGCAKQHGDDACDEPSDSDECNVVVGVVPSPDAPARGSATYPGAATGLIAYPDAAQGPAPGGGTAVGVNVVPDQGPLVGNVGAPDAGAADASIVHADAAASTTAADADVDAGCPPFEPGNFSRLEDGRCIPIGIHLQYNGE